MKILKYILSLSLIAITAGCCIGSRARVKETHVVASGYHVTYYSDEVVTNVTSYGTYKYNKSIAYTTSYVGGPWEGSFIYPATRQTLNALSLYSYSSAASGDYMLALPTLCVYPIVLIELPIQFCLDTLLIPYDMWNVPHPPEGYKQRK